MIKIYFAGSIRGGREDAALYRQLIRLLKGYGYALTEHVGDPDAAEEGLSDGAIYRRDMRWLEEADVVVAEVTVPSHGVGYEIARAEGLGKPILCLHRSDAGRPPSALVAGNPHLRCETYRHLDEAAEIVKRFLQRDGKREQG